MMVKTTRVLLAAVSMILIMGCVPPEPVIEVPPTEVRYLSVGGAEVRVFKDNVAGNTCYLYRNRGISCVPTHKEDSNVQ
jgi:hypothetical protein